MREIDHYKREYEDISEERDQLEEQIRKLKQQKSSPITGTSKMPELTGANIQGKWQMGDKGTDDGSRLEALERENSNLRKEIEEMKSLISELLP